MRWSHGFQIMVHASAIDRQTVTFAPEFIEQFIAQSEKFDWETVAEHPPEGRRHEHPVTIGTRHGGLLARYY